MIAAYYCFEQARLDKAIQDFKKELLANNNTQKGANDAVEVIECFFNSEAVKINKLKPVFDKKETVSE